MSSTIAFRFLLTGLHYLYCAHGRDTHVFMFKILASITNSLLNWRKSFAPGSIVYKEGHSNIYYKSQSVYINSNTPILLKYHIITLFKDLKTHPSLSAIHLFLMKILISKTINLFFPFSKWRAHLIKTESGDFVLHLD